MDAEKYCDIVENKIGDRIVAAAIAIHSALGPGLLESAYEVCLAHELGKRGHRVRSAVFGWATFSMSPAEPPRPPR